MKLLNISKIYTCLFFISLNSLFAQSTIHRSKSMTSTILNKEIKYSIYLPNNYNNSEKEYPTIYMLNGFTGNELDWINSGNLQTVADSLTINKKLMESIIIMPDGDDRLYMNNKVDSYPYEDMFIKELIPYISSTYRTKDSKKHRAISGLSMGGSGSIRLAFRHPEVFGTCAAFSAAVFTNSQIKNMDQKFYDSYFGRISSKMVGLKGENRITESYRNYDILELINTQSTSLKNTIDLYFDCGDDDFLTIGNASLHIELSKQNIQHEFRMRDGEHTWEYWNKSIIHGLLFINNSFSK